MNGLFSNDPLASADSERATLNWWDDSSLIRELDEDPERRGIIQLWKETVQTNLGDVQDRRFPQLVVMAYAAMHDAEPEVAGQLSPMFHQGGSFFSSAKYLISMANAFIPLLPKADGKIMKIAVKNIKQAIKSDDRWCKVSARWNLLRRFCEGDAERVRCVWTREMQALEAYCVFPVLKKVQNLQIGEELWLPIHMHEAAWSVSHVFMCRIVKNQDRLFQISYINSAYADDTREMLAQQVDGLVSRTCLVNVVRFERISENQAMNRAFYRNLMHIPWVSLPLHSNGTIESVFTHYLGRGQVDPDITLPQTWGTCSYSGLWLTLQKSLPSRLYYEFDFFLRNRIFHSTHNIFHIGAMTLRSRDKIEGLKKDLSIIRNWTREYLLDNSMEHIREYGALPIAWQRIIPHKRNQPPSLYGTTWLERKVLAQKDRALARKIRGFK